jgi:hypothetical protein
MEMQGLCERKDPPQMQDLVARVAGREKTGFWSTATRHFIKNVAGSSMQVNQTLGD